MAYPYARTLKSEPVEADAQRTAELGPGAQILPWDTGAPSEQSHLVACRKCEAMNGRSAPFCWNCETDRTASASAEPESLGSPEIHGPDTIGQISSFIGALPGDAPPTREMVTLPPEFSTFKEGGSMLPVLNSALPMDEPLAMHFNGKAPSKSRERVIIVASIAAVILLAVGWSALNDRWPFDPPADSRAAQRDAYTPGDTLGTTPRSAHAESDYLDSGRTLSYEVLSPKDPSLANPTQDTLPAQPPPQDVRPAPASPRARGATQAASRAAWAALELQRRNTRDAKSPIPSNPSANAESAPLGPCTAAVQALGLCSAPTVKPKE
jgi:hypothetical protein